MDWLVPVVFALVAAAVAIAIPLRLRKARVAEEVGRKPLFEELGSVVKGTYLRSSPRFVRLSVYEDFIVLRTVFPTVIRIGEIGEAGLESSSLYGERLRIRTRAGADFHLTLKNRAQALAVLQGLLKR